MLKGQNLLEKITSEVCTCIENKKANLQKLSDTELKMQLGFCILESYNANEKEVNARYGKIMDDEKAMEKFGEEIGLKMATVCPETLMAVAGKMIEVEEKEVPKLASTEALSIEGTVTEIKNEQFATIVLKDKNARMYNFLILDYFETASLFTNNEVKPKDKIKVSYKEVELYDTKLKEFRYFRIVLGLEKI